ncbi:NADPH oxidase 5-like [Pollicipes pollicipes]|uniref:NADPH oxidase 5-like n=1 Tax=Pollicipes pollicipes TaxID=41117 RepID=UPI0018855FB6|nr:NADPH oxidase 5-like [Pollicipes pollicipes]
MVHHVQNNLGMVVFYSFLAVINSAVFVATLFLRDSGWIMAATSGLGKCLLLDSALLPITVCRRILAWVRETPLHAFSPLNNHRKVHRIISLSVCIISVAHSATAIGHYYVKSRKPGSPSLFSLLFHTSHRFGWLNLGLLNISGIACLVTMAIIVATSLLRHHMTFLAFFLTHQLYVVLYGLMIIHAGNFWVYLLLPVCLWSAELLLRFIYSPRPSNIVEVTLLPSNVSACRSALAASSSPFRDLAVTVAAI